MVRGGGGTPCFTGLSEASLSTSVVLDGDRDDPFRVDAQRLAAADGREAHGALSEEQHALLRRQRLGRLLAGGCVGGELGDA